MFDRARRDGDVHVAPAGALQTAIEAGRTGSFARSEVPGLSCWQQQLLVLEFLRCARATQPFEQHQCRDRDHVSSRDRALQPGERATRSRQHVHEHRRVEVDDHRVARLQPVRRERRVSWSSLSTADCNRVGGASGCRGGCRSAVHARHPSVAPRAQRIARSPRGRRGFAVCAPASPSSAAPPPSRRRASRSVLACRQYYLPPSTAGDPGQPTFIHAW